MAFKPSSPAKIVYYYNFIIDFCRDIIKLLTLSLNIQKIHQKKLSEDLQVKIK